MEAHERRSVVDSAGDSALKEFGEVDPLQEGPPGEAGEEGEGEMGSPPGRGVGGPL